MSRPLVAWLEALPFELDEPDELDLPLLFEVDLAFGFDAAFFEALDAFDVFLAAVFAPDFAFDFVDLVAFDVFDFAPDFAFALLLDEVVLEPLLDLPVAFFSAI